MSATCHTVDPVVEQEVLEGYYSTSKIHNRRWTIIKNMLFYDTGNYMTMNKTYNEVKM